MNKQNFITMQTFLLTTAIAVGLHSCNSDDYAPPAPPTIPLVFPIVGTWQHAGYETVFYKDITFCDDETGSGTKYEYDKEKERRTDTFVYTYNTNTKEQNVITNSFEKNMYIYNSDTKEMDIITKSIEGDRWKATITELTATTLCLHIFYYYTYDCQTTEYSIDEVYTRIK